MRYAILFSTLMLFQTITGRAQKKEYTEQISKELTFESKSSNASLAVKNFIGSIRVEGYTGDIIKLEAQKTIRAGDAQGLELGKKEMGLKVVHEKNRITIYPEAPFIFYREGSLIYDNHGMDPPYSFAYDFKLKVPIGIDLILGTGTDGDILVENVRGDSINVSNIDGDITLRNISGYTNVNAMEGEVTIMYSRNPLIPCDYFSANGNLQVFYQKDLSADIIFKSREGEFFTDFDFEKQDAQVNTTVESGDENATTYIYKSRPVIHIGRGDVTHTFETLSGNVTIKKYKE